MKEIRRVILIVLDSVGIGAAPDADLYGDANSDTIGNIARRMEGFCLPNLNKLGFHFLNDSYKESCAQIPAEKELIGSYGILTEKSVGKDTTTGHWELTGIILNEPFPVYPNGFPDEIIRRFIKETGRGILGNIAASGTEIIKDLGEAHLKTGDLIVYTSADSVFQIAAHEELIPIETLYEYCLSARKILSGEHAVSRVIARPFLGNPGNFYRTTNRKDFSLTPPENTLLDMFIQAGLSVTGVGKISDIFAGRGITISYKTTGNTDGIDRTIQCIKDRGTGIIFTNLIDFDMLYGHRNDPQGYADALAEFDRRVPEIIESLRTDDILIITADHGCDPTSDSTDHTREMVPLLVYGNHFKKSVNIGTRKTFADVAATIAEVFSFDYQGPGCSFLRLLRS